MTQMKIPPCDAPSPRFFTDDRPFKCDFCPKSFARKQQCRNHIVVHTGDRAYLCFECGSSFGSPSTLTDHRKRRHLLVSMLEPMLHLH